MKFILILILILSAPNAFAVLRKASIFAIGKTQDAALFTQETDVVESPTGDNKSWTSKIMNPKGEVVMTEVVTLKDGRMAYQYVEQPQIQEAYELSVDGGKAHYKTYEFKDGKKGRILDTSTLKIDDSFITGPITEYFLLKNRPALDEGKVVKAEFGVFEMHKAFTFEFKKIKETPTSIEIEMKPTSMFVAMVVKPMKLELNKEQKRIVRFTGRTPIRIKEKGSIKPIDAEVIYY